MAIFVLVLSILLLLLAIAASLRLVRRTGRRRPWVLLSAALALMISRRVIALAAAFADPPRPPDLAQELVALVIAAIGLVAIRALGGLIDDMQRVSHDQQETQESFRSLVANLPMIASVVDSSGSVRFLNPAQLETVTGYTPAELASPEGWRAIIHPEDLEGLERGLSRALQGETVPYLGRFVHRNGSLKWAGTTFYPRRENGHVVGLNALTSDVTERISLEEQLRQAQKMEALGAMAGGIAHDFNNLLSSILGNVELAERRIPPDHAARKNLDDAARAALRASEHARQILDFGRRTVPDPRPVSLNDACREAVTLLRHAVDPRVEFRVRTEVGLWEVMGDPGELVQILVNLLLNARDVLPEGGQVLLETSNVVLDETYARVHAEGRVGEFARLVVADDGPGMPPDVRARIFEPFFTTKEAGRGTGLGLALVYGTVRRHDGWVSCYSEVGRGTRFAVYLPRAPAEVARPSPDQTAQDVPGGDETVLLVDDDDDLRAVGVESLRDLGYSVLTARDGLEALDVYAAERERLRLVILDLSMPRLNGRDTLARLRAQDAGLPVLVTSGHAMEGEARLLIAQGAIGFVEKPYRLAQIGSAVRAALDRSRDTRRASGTAGG